MTLASNLSNIRAKKGLTLETVAKGINSSKSYVWEIENGVTDNPGIKTVMALASYYKVSVNTLIKGIKQELSK